MANTDFEDEMLGVLGEDGGSMPADTDDQQDGGQQDDAGTQTRDRSTDESFDDIVRGSQKGADQVSADQQTQSDQPAQGKQPAKTGSDQSQPEVLRAVQGMSGIFTDSKGNLVAENGQVIAAAGRERRMLQENIRMRSDNERLRGEYDTLAERVRNFEPVMQQMQETRQLMQQHNINSEEARDAMQLVAMFKANPVAAAKDVVARAMALGHNASDILGQEVGDSVDMRAMQHLMNQQRQQGQGDQTAVPANGGVDDVERRSVEAAELFFERHPDARLHENDIAAIVTRQGVSAYEAYRRLRAFVDDNNLSWDQPILQQMETRIAADGGKQQAQQPAASAPMTRGAGNPTSMQDAGATPMNAGSASADASWNEIMDLVKADMRRGAN